MSRLNVDCGPESPGAQGSIMSNESNEQAAGKSTEPDFLGKKVQQGLKPNLSF
jgi:hypothetical protein